MSGRVRCPSCQSVFEFKEKDRGTKISCPECSKALAIPKAKAAAESPRPKSADSIKAGPPKLPASSGQVRTSKRVGEVPGKSKISKPPKKKGRRGPVFWIAMSVCILAVAGGITVAAILWLPKPPETVGVGQVNPNFDLGPSVITTDGEAVALRENVLGIMPEDFAEVEVSVPAKPIAVSKDPLPANIASEAVQRVKRSTVYLRVEAADGRMGEGSGFCALAPGIVVTNAHVVGMLSAGSGLPKHVEVVIYSGEPNEKRFTGQVLGVDRRTDLAVVRIPNDPALPPPLPVDSATTLTELQKVYIFGFPLGARLGKQITVAESTVSSLRKDRNGNMLRVQVNGGMHHGNSGGPVVDARGHVVAVSVSIIAGTSLHFGVPGDFVQEAGDGKIISVSPGDPYKQGDQVLMDYELTLLDPLKKVSGVKVASWYGPAGPQRLKHDPKAGDGPRQMLEFVVKDGKAKGTLVLPKAEHGKSLYTQPGLVRSATDVVWAFAKANSPQPVIERKPATLEFKNEVGRNKLFVDTFSRVGISSERVDFRMQAHVDEDRKPNGETADASLKYERVRVGQFTNGKPIKQIGQLAQVARAMKQVDSIMEVDRTGSVLQSFLNFPKGPRPPFEVGMTSLHDQLLDGFQTVSIPIPNKQVNPGETWKGERSAKVVRTPVTLALTCTYAGTRTRGGREEAVINIAGTARGSKENEVQGEVTGRAIYDLTTSMVTSAKLEARLTMKITSTAGGLLPISGTVGTQLTRRLATDPAETKEILRVTDKLTGADSRDFVRGGHHKVFKIPVKAGRTYVIDMVSDKGNPAHTFDPYLRLEDSEGNELDEDDDSGGDLNSHILFLASADGEYSIIVTTFETGQTGAFTLTVKEG